MLPLDSIVPLISFTNLATWVLITVGCIVGRGRGTTGVAGRYRAPFFPAPQVISLLAVAGLTVLVWEDPVNGRPGVIAVGVVVVLSVLYHALVLQQRVGGWKLLSSPADDSSI